MSRSVFFSCRRSHKEGRAFQFAFSLEPIFKFTARQAAVLLINFVSTAPDVLVIERVVSRAIFDARLNGAFVKFQILISLAFQGHTCVLSLRVELLLILSVWPRSGISSQRSAKGRSIADSTQ